ncbi:MAG: hypothetical protein ACPL5F_12690 [Moorellaceae bacterium]
MPLDHDAIFKELISPTYLGLSPEEEKEVEEMAVVVRDGKCYN